MKCTKNIPVMRNEDKKKLLNNFGQRLRDMRIKRNLTQEQLGELSSVNHKYIGELERGEKNPTVIILYKISMALGITISELLSLKED